MRADLAIGSVWDSHCHLDFLARRLAKVGIRHGHSLAVSLQQEEEAREVMREVGVAANHRIHLHCFSSSWEMADSWLQAYPGAKLGLTALVTFPHAKEVHEVARRVPLGRLLLETDAPYFLPRQVSQGAAYSHRFAMPGHVVHVAAQIAAIRGVPVQEVLRANRRNIAEVYGIVVKT